jgi:hypothetical protein
MMMKTEHGRAQRSPLDCPPDVEKHQNGPFAFVYSEEGRNALRSFGEALAQSMTLQIISVAAVSFTAGLVLHGLLSDDEGCSDG